MAGGPRTAVELTIGEAPMASGVRAGSAVLTVLLRPEWAVRGPSVTFIYSTQLLRGVVHPPLRLLDLQSRDTAEGAGVDVDCDIYSASAAAVAAVGTVATRAGCKRGDAGDAVADAAAVMDTAGGGARLLLYDDDEDVLLEGVS